MDESTEQWELSVSNYHSYICGKVTSIICFGLLPFAWFLTYLMLLLFIYFLVYDFNECFNQRKIDLITLCISIISYLLLIILQVERIDTSSYLLLLFFHWSWDGGGEYDVFDPLILWGKSIHELLNVMLIALCFLRLFLLFFFTWTSYSLVGRLSIKIN